MSHPSANQAQHCLTAVRELVFHKLIRNFPFLNPTSLSVPTEYSFPDLKLCGKDELGDNNQVAVALVLIPLELNNRRRENCGVAWVNYSERLRVHCILLGERIRYTRKFTRLRQVFFFLS